MVDNPISKKVKEIAKKRDITLKQIASKIEMSESGFLKSLNNNLLKVENLIKIAEVLQVPIGFFFSLDNDPFYEKLIDLQERCDYLEIVNKNSISVEELEKLCKEIDKKASNGEGLIYLGFDMIRQKFITQYSKIELK